MVRAAGTETEKSDQPKHQHHLSFNNNCPVTTAIEYTTPGTPSSNLIPWIFGHLTGAPPRYLLDADHSHGAVQASVLAFSNQFIVDLAGAENYSLHLLWLDGCRPVVWDYPLKMCACSITNTHAVTQKKRKSCCQFQKRRG